MAGTMSAELPPGFVLDKDDPAELPNGFVLDDVAPEVAGANKAFSDKGIDPQDPNRYARLFVDPEESGTTMDSAESFARGLVLNFGSGGLQGLYSLGEKLGIEGAKEAREEMEIKRNQANAISEQRTSDSPIASTVGELAGEVAPALMIPGGVSGGLGKKMLTGAAAGAGIGASGYVDEGGSRAENAALGATFGSAGPVIGKVAKAAVVNPVKGAIEKVKPLFGRISDDLVQEMAGETLEQGTKKTLRAASKLDETLTPAEATGRARLAAKQGRLGTTEKSANLLEDTLKKRADAQAVKIHDFLSDVSRSGKSAAGDVRKAANDVLDDLSKVRAKAARPFYQEAYSKVVEPAKLKELIDDPIISEAFDSVGKSTIWQKRLKGIESNSVEYLHIVKEALDDKIGALVRAGANKEAGIVIDSKKGLLSALEEVAPEYKTARNIYSSASKAIDGVKESAVGKIAQLPDLQLKSVSKIVFDATETNAATRNKLRAMLSKKDPDAWNRLLRNEFERRLDQMKGDVRGSSFYSSVLAKPKDFKMWMDATKGQPEIRKRLIWMRRAWKDLINQESVKGAAGKAKSSLDVPRSSVEATMNLVKEVAGGKMDTAAVRLIFSDKWASDLQRINSMASKKSKTEALAALLGKASAAEASEE